jgi:hypothetical protein
MSSALAGVTRIANAEATRTNASLQITPRAVLADSQRPRIPNLHRTRRDLLTDSKLFRLDGCLSGPKIFWV